MTEARPHDQMTTRDLQRRCKCFSAPCTARANDMGVMSIIRRGVTSQKGLGKPDVLNH